MFNKRTARYTCSQQRFNLGSRPERRISCYLHLHSHRAGRLWSYEIPAEREMHNDRKIGAGCYPWRRHVQVDISVTIVQLLQNTMEHALRLPIYIFIYLYTYHFRFLDILTCDNDDPVFSTCGLTKKKCKSNELRIEKRNCDNQN